MKQIWLVPILALLAGGTAPAATTTVSGTLINVASYVTGDAAATTFNMGAMMGSNGGNRGGMGNYGGMGNNGGMMGGSYGPGANGAGMYACRSALGLLAPDGQVYLLAVDAPSFNVYNLCRDLGSRVTLRGTTYTRGGVHVLRVESFSVASTGARSGSSAASGRDLYAANCSSCHGTNGYGGMGPNLHGVGGRMTFSQTVAFIENPPGAMPKLYPGQISSANVQAIARYIRAAFK